MRRLLQIATVQTAAKLKYVERHVPYSKTPGVKSQSKFPFA